jgi:diacylglycerol O-acyltransferase
VDRLTPLSTSFLDAEDVDPRASLAIGSLAIFAGPVPEFDEFVETIRGRLPLIPRYRQKLRRVPFDLAPPTWVDDPDFDLSWHVRSTALPDPGGREEVARLLSRVMAARMDRSRPLWEYWFVEGLADGRWAFLSKLHHSMADGVSGSDLYRLVLDPTPTPRPPAPDTWEPGRPGSPWAWPRRAARGLVTVPASTARTAVHALAAPSAVLAATVRTTRGLASIAGAALPVDATSLTGHLDGSRRYAWTSISLSGTRAARRALGVSINDLALAAVAGGFRELLMSRGEEPDRHAVRTLVPVSTRAPGEEGITDNRVSLMLPYLPVDVHDPFERLEEVHRRIAALQQQHEPEAGGAVTRIAEHLWFLPVSWGMRVALRVPQRQIATVTTNVPGPRTTLYALGCELQEMLPYVPIADRVRIGVAMFSYRDTLVFGITGDYRSSPDLDVLTRGIETSVAELCS